MTDQETRITTTLEIENKRKKLEGVMDIASSSMSSIDIVKDYSVYQRNRELIDDDAAGGYARFLDSEIWY